MLRNVLYLVCFNKYELSIYDILGIVLGIGYRDEKVGIIFLREFEFSGNWKDMCIFLGN